MKANLLMCLILILPGYANYAQQRVELASNEIVQFPTELIHKVGSGDLQKSISEKLKLMKEDPDNKALNEKIETVIYLENYPTSNEMNAFQSLGLDVSSSSWTPPVYNHSFGFILASIPVEKINDALELNFVKRIDSAEELSYPQNNEADKVLNAVDVWTMGWTGEGIKVGILDSGLDTDPVNPDLPSGIIKKDYSSFPNLDDDVENHVTGHGTHVTGSVLGRGILSSDNSGNGGDPYLGIAPDASLVFLKIGNDYTAGASTNAIVNALDAAVNIYNVEVISMSYGSWDIYHDGSSPKEQKVDWCYNQGVPVFLAAGNEGASARHYSGVLAANDSSGFIKVNITDALPNSSYLIMNMVWFDGPGVHNDLSIKYYNSSFQSLTNVYNYTPTESPKGTDSKISQITSPVPTGNSTYYLKVFNNSGTIQKYHLYEHNKDPKVKFDNPDPEYTVVSPANATYGFCVGAFSSRVDWTDYNGTVHSTGEIQDELADYSSRGPRIDEIQKPDIVAPGGMIISIRDRDVLTVPDFSWIDDDGIPQGNSDYLVMQGTSMAAPLCAGAAALFLSKFPDATPQNIYDAIRNYATADAFTGTVPNSFYGFGKLDIYKAIISVSSLPVELNSFSAALVEGNVSLRWKTETEVNNYGFEILRSTQNDNWESMGFVEGHGNSNSPKHYSFTDDLIPDPAHTLYYRLKQIDNDGKFEYSKVIEVNLDSPENFELSQNYPNPFNPVTTISFTIPVPGNVRLSVFNILGQEVATLTNGFLDAGVHTFNFNAEGLSSGSYIYQLISEGTTLTRKMLLLK